MLGIIGAMDGEVAGLKEKMTDPQIMTMAGMDFYKGEINGSGVVVVKSGICKVNAAVCTQILCDIYKVDAIINTGVAGSLNAQINIGDIVLSESVIHHDVEATVFGYEYGQIPQMKVKAFPGDPGLMAVAERACRNISSDIQVRRGLVLSGDQFISSTEKKKWLKDTFDGDCVEMEGAAIAQTAWLNQVPFLILRSISDKADNSAQMDYDVFEKKAMKNSIALMLEMIREMAK